MSATNRSKPAVILLAEDDPGDQKLARRALEKGRIRNDLRVVGDGEEALDYLLHRGAYAAPGAAPRPDLLLLDLNMPKLDGRQVLEAIRGRPELARMRVVVLTTSGQEADVERCYGLGAHSYVQKPLALPDFMRVLQALGEYWLEIVVLPPEGEE